jgi:hypothetical protein
MDIVLNRNHTLFMALQFIQCNVPRRYLNLQKHRHNVNNEFCVTHRDQMCFLHVGLASLNTNSDYLQKHHCHRVETQLQLN